MQHCSRSLQPDALAVASSHVTCQLKHTPEHTCVKRLLNLSRCWRATRLLFWHMQREKDEVGCNEMNSCHSSYSEGRCVVIATRSRAFVFEYLCKCENFWNLDYYICCFSCKLGQITNSVVENGNQSWCKLALQRNVAYGSCHLSALAHHVISRFAWRVCLVLHKHLTQLYFLIYVNESRANAPLLSVIGIVFSYSYIY